MVFSEGVIGFWAGPPCRVGQGPGAEGARKFFGLFLEIKLEKYDSKWHFYYGCYGVLPKLEHIE